MHGRVWVDGTKQQFDALEMALMLSTGFRYRLNLSQQGPDLWCLSYGFINEDIGDIEPEYGYWLRISKMARKIGMNVKVDGVFAPKEKTE